MTDRAASTVEAAGAVLIVAGVGLWSVPVALVVAGVLMVVASNFAGRG